MIIVIPTGGGKTAVYALPCIMKPGLAVVISPLMMLMCDQVARLREYGINTCYFNTLLSDSARPRKPNITQKFPIGSLYRGKRCRRIALGY